MIAFIIKLTLSLLILYFAYRVILAKENIPGFKRYFLLGCIVFSIVVSIIEIKVHVPVSYSLSSSAINYRIDSNFTNLKSLNYQSSNPFSMQWIVNIIYFLVVFLLLTRFIINISRLAKLEQKNPKIEFNGFKIVLVNHHSLPYSFLNSVFVNEQEYKDGNITKELLFHEFAHIRQNHTLDIIFVELLQILFWFNPLIWFYKKEIQLNHEYLADNAVLDSDIKIQDYQDFLINVAFRNNSSYLASSFNYSLTKKRLIMLTREKSSKRALVKQIMLIPIFTLLAVTMAFSQNGKQDVRCITETRAEFLNNMQKEWWYPILQKHKKEPRGFNNFRNIFEMGDGNSIDNGICTLTNAFVIVRDSADNYTIIESPLLYHDFKNETIKANSGTIKRYKKNSSSIEPYEIFQSEKLELHVVKN